MSKASTGEKLSSKKFHSKIKDRVTFNFREESLNKLIQEKEEKFICKASKKMDIFHRPGCSKKMCTHYFSFILNQISFLAKFLTKHRDSNCFLIAGIIMNSNLYLFFSNIMDFE